jgi:uncharacterized circularly permuted ATP-grasp superfamily protein
MSDLLASYEMGRFFDGLVDGNGGVRDPYLPLVCYLEQLGLEGLERSQRNAELSLLNQGITFTVYSDADGKERIFPFDLIPRLISAETWMRIEAGIAQRLRALNRFLEDVYGEQQILKDRVVPTDLVVTSPLFRRQVFGVRPPGGIYVHVAGIDLIQDETGRYVVLEDNLRVPSGVSYLVENRRVMSRVMPDLLQHYEVRAVDHYPRLLLETLQSLTAQESPNVAVLTPGVYNSAYFEHSFLAAQMGVELVEGRDLLVERDVLYMKTTAGLQRVDALYRRVDVDFLDPVVFRPDSMLGVPGLMHAFRAGNVALANVPGTGVADDKAMYAYVPAIIRYYLSEDPILPQVPTYLCRDPKQRAHVFDHLSELVVKPTDGSGGYGLLIGPSASQAELERCRERIQAEPDRFVAQPVQELSTLPTFIDQDGSRRLCPRHVDLRPFALCRADGEITVLPGGLTRVALPRGSLVVNSSQGGGSKDTWVLRGTGADDDA